MNRSPRTLLLFIAGMIAASLTGCSTVQAVRVQPWERGLLADSIMDPNRDPLGSAMMEHVTSSRKQRLAAKAWAARDAAGIDRLLGTS